MAQPYLDQLKSLLVAFDSDPSLTCRHFFSGAALYVGPKLCASLTPPGLAFKLPEPRCEELIRLGKAIPLRYFDRSPTKKGYVLFPAYQTLSVAELDAYFAAAIALARSNLS